MSLFDEVLGGLGKIPVISDELNRVAINHIASRTTPRPRPFSLWSEVPAPAPTTPPKLPAIGPVNDYTSWPGLTDRTFSSRHLPPADKEYLGRLKSTPADFAELFRRVGPMRKDRSSALFMFFAQWFTDSVLRVNPSDRRRNTSNHDIDLCQIYGLTEETARMLRTMKNGHLRCQVIDGEIYPDYLYEQDALGAPLRVKECYAALPYLGSLDTVFDGVPLERRRKAYATGLERGNSTIGYTAISTVFLREHNRICDELAQRHPGWNDERLFQTARMINIVLLMKVVVEDYINHIAGNKIFKLDHRFAEDQKWYRTNWISIEFDLLYRWHSLVPDSIQVGSETVSANDFRNNNELLEQRKIKEVLNSASTQAAGRIGLRNTPDFLWPAEMVSLAMSRDLRLRPYNEYRVQFGLDKLDSFEELTSDPEDLKALRSFYTTVDDVELMIGLLAERRGHGALFGDLLNTMVAYDAFTQIFTNPLLSQNVFGPATFSEYGMQLIKQTSSFHDIASRNVKGDFKASLGV